MTIEPISSAICCARVGSFSMRATSWPESEQFFGEVVADLATTDDEDEHGQASMAAPGVAGRGPRRRATSTRDAGRIGVMVPPGW